MTSSRRGLRIRQGEERASLRRLIILTFLVFAVFLVTPVVVKSAAEANWVVIDDPNKYFDAIPRSGAALVYWKQEACPGCKKVEPAVIKFSIENPEVKVIVAHIDYMLRSDADATLELLSRLRVYGTPTFIVYKDGVEVARHVSTFGPGDQYDPLVDFVKSSLAGKAPELRPITGTTTPVDLEGVADPVAIATYMTYAFALGLIAAISPCSLPVIAVFATSSRGGEEDSRRFKLFITNSIGIAATAIGFGSVLSLMYVIGVFLPVNPYVILVFLAAAFIVAWGLENLNGRDPIIAGGRRLRKLLPVLGLQCSLPFLIAMISMVSVAPHIVFGASLMFAAGYSLPYALAGALGGDFAIFLSRVMGSKKLVRIQGLVLLVAGLYIYYSNYDALL